MEEAVEFDWGQFRQDMKEHSQKKRAHNRCASTEILRQEGVEFEIKSEGVHLIVRGNGKVIDFWPGTGKWINRKKGHGRGVFNLLRHLRAEVKSHESVSKS